MPVFTEKASAQRDQRVNPAHATTLPRATSPPPPKERQDGAPEELYEVVVVGSGPAGMMTSVLLARFGITSVLTVDSKPEQLKSGQADGLQPRTLEVLQSLDLAHEVLTQGCQMHEVGFWNPTPDGKGIERTSFVPDVVVPARYPHEITIHQGRIERIMNEDLEKNGNTVQRAWTMTGHEFAGGEFPVKVSLTRTKGEGEGTRTIRCKFLVGADGARSIVREGMGLKLVGDHSDHVWGVMDSVVKTTFPDIRKRCAIHSEVGSIMIIPRERISGNKVLTRVYCQMEDDVERDPDVAAEPAAMESREIENTKKAKSKQRREKVTLERIIAQAKRVLAPYDITFNDVDWWAAYQIGQRAALSFSAADPKDRVCVKRVHIVGDACHTHSPKAGQGMNVSMMDAFNLSWKLAHVLNGLAPASLMDTYEHERLDIARQLIDFDTKFSTMFSGKIGAETGLTHEQFVDVFSKGSGFTSGCGIGYVEGKLVDKTGIGIIKTAAPESGILVPGRRLLNVKTKRFTDANPREIHDDIPTTGQYRILVLLPQQFRRDPRSLADKIEQYNTIIPDLFEEGVIQTVTIFPGERGTLEWTDFPASIRDRSEWLLLGDHYGVAYNTYGVDVEKGAVAVIRPDGYVGMVGTLENAGRVEEFLARGLVKV